MIIGHLFLMEHEKMEILGVNKTLYDWALHSRLMAKVFKIEDDTLIKDHKEIKTLLEKLFANQEEEKILAGNYLYNKLWGSYPQFGPLPPFELLREFEHENVYYKNYRDHTTHLIFTCFLGLYIYENNDAIKNSFSDPIKNFKIDLPEDQVFVLLWMLSSLYHDIGYLLENYSIYDPGSDVFCKFQNKIDQLLRNPLAYTPCLNIKNSTENTCYSKCKKLRFSQKVFDSIFDIVGNETNLKYLKSASDSSNLTFIKEINGIEKYLELTKTIPLKSRADKVFIDHGIGSALLLLYIWFNFREHIECVAKNKQALKYFKCSELIIDLNRNIKLFEQIVKIAAQAISLHNIDKFSWQEEDFSRAEIDASSFVISYNDNNLLMPLAFLLRICDELHVWDRPYFRPPSSKDDVLYSKDLNIIVRNNGIFLRFFKDEELFINPASYPDGRYRKIIQTLKNYLDPEELNSLLKYESYFPISDGRGNFLRLFRDEYNTDNLKNLGTLLCNCGDGNISEKDEFGNNDKMKNVGNKNDTELDINGRSEFGNQIAELKNRTDSLSLSETKKQYQ